MRKFAKPTDLLAASIESAWRWPDPFEAPDVPARPIVEAFATGIITAVDDPELALQIGQSMNCRRALDFIRATGLPKGQQLEQLRKSIQTKHFGARQHTPESRVHIGTAWATSPVALVFDRTCRASFRWRLSSPPVALLVDGPVKTRNDVVWRAILATPAEERIQDWLREDEILVEMTDGSSWHAHLWLEFSISHEQLGVELCRLHATSFENIKVARSALREGSPLPVDTQRGSPIPQCIPRSEQSDRKREREQLLERAQWLAAEADSRLAANEWEAEIQEIIKETPEDYFEVRSPEAQLAFASGMETVTPAFLVALTEGTDARQVLRGCERLEQVGKPLLATLKQKPVALGTGRLSALWKLLQPLPGSTVSALVAVVDSVSKRVIGHARVDVEGVVRWDAPLTKMGDIPLAERLALIVFLSP